MWSAGFRVQRSGSGVGLDLGLEVLKALHQVALHLLLVRVQPGFVLRF